MRVVSKKLLKFYGNNSHKWTKGEYARDDSGRGVTPTNPNAVSWCIEGTLYKMIDKGDITYKQKIYWHNIVYNKFNKLPWDMNDNCKDFDELKKFLKEI